MPLCILRSYAESLLRATIALIVAVALALIPSRGNAAGGSEASTPESPGDAPQSPGDAPEGSDAGDAAPGTHGSPLSRTGGLSQQPFSDADARTGVSGDASGDAEDDADGEGADYGEDAPGSPLRTLSCLEGEGGNEADGARRGVQKRGFLKRHRFEISAMGGYYASDALSSTYMYGGALSFFPSEDFGLEVLVTRNPVQFRLEEPFSTFDQERHFTPGTAWNALAAMLWAPIHAKLRWTERGITHADLFIVAGAGRTLHESAQGLSFEAGFGLKVYLAHYVSLRLDARNFIVPQEVLGRGRITHNVAIMLGLSGWLPG